MSVTVAQNERPYLSYPYHALETIANENWEEHNTLQSLLYELQFRKTAFALYLKQQIEKQIEELKLECFRFPSTESPVNSVEMEIIDRQ